MALQSIAQNIQAVRRAIAAAAADCARDPADIALIAVSKQQPPDALRAAWVAGARAFGENYLHEAIEKQDTLGDLGIEWHFIGAIQSNKTRLIANRFHWVHTVANRRVAHRLSDQAAPGTRLNVCIQINIDRDPNKAGVAPEAAAALLAEIRDLPNLSIRGLMTILHPASPPRAGYERLATLFETLRAIAPSRWDTLSMGMSADFPDAIAAGATHIRVGSAIFGPRPARLTS
jgi:pyridoxal phosphate enzyme (YggS family)